MYDNREAILKEFGSELIGGEDTLKSLQQNGPWFCFLLMMVLGVQLGRYLVGKIYQAISKENQPSLDVSVILLLGYCHQS